MLEETSSIGLLFQPCLPSLIVNLYSPRARENSFAWVIADGRHLPFKDRAFDITYSNSVIEHLGDFTSQQAFAREVSRVAACYFGNSAKLTL